MGAIPIPTSRSEERRLFVQLRAENARLRAEVGRLRVYESEQWLVLIEAVKDNLPMARDLLVALQRGAENEQMQALRVGALAHVNAVLAAARACGLDPARAANEEVRP